jgi:uncharacterized protein YndB with AHSA1/START domain
MISTTDTRVTTQVYAVYIKATPQAIWDAITKPEWTERYGYTALVEYDLRPGGSYRAVPSEAMKKAGAEMGYPIPDVAVDGEVIEADPPNKLVQTWRMLMDPTMAGEGFTRLTWEIQEMQAGVSKLTVVHDLEGAPKLAGMLAGKMEPEGAGGGWSEVLSDLKTLLETGESLRS